MNKELNEIAARIRELREVCGFTQEELANQLGIDLRVYQEYEADGADIPISVIYEIAHKCGVDFTEIITGIGAKLDTYHVVRRGEGKSVSRFQGYNFEDLAYRYSHKIMQPLLVTLDPSEKPADLVSHAGQEFNLVLEGTVSLVFDNKEIILKAGDSIYFNPTHPHGQKCVGDVKARFLTVITE